MASLSNTKIKDTYQSLVKFSDNGNITISAKRLTDGFGNNSPLYVSTTQIGIGITPQSGYGLHVSNNVKIGGDLEVSGNLTVNGTLTYLNVVDLEVDDPLIQLAVNNAANILDIGLFGKYVSSGTKYKGLFNDASDNKFKLFTGLTEKPLTTINTSATGYTKGNLVIGGLEATTGTFTGNVIVDPASGDAILLLQSSTQTLKIDQNSIRTSTSTNLSLLTNNTLALRIDTSQNSTFAGSVTAPIFAGNLTGNAYLNTIAYQGGEGTKLDNSAFNVDGIGTTFRWIESNSGATGTTWKKVADVVCAGGTVPSGVQMEVKVLQPNVNDGSSASLNTIYYSIAFRGRIDDGNEYNNALVYGQDSDLIRVYKSASLTFELQARSNDDNRDLVVECNITSKKGGKVTPTTTYTDGTITGGTAYTASGNALNKTKFAGNVEFEGAIFDSAEVEDLRVNEYLFLGAQASTQYGPYLIHSNSGGTGFGVRLVVRSDLQVWGVTGNAGEQNQGLYVAGGVAKLYDLNGVVLETVLGGVDVTGTLDVSGTITGDVTGDVTGDLTGNVTGASSLNVLKAGDTMTGDLTLNDDVELVLGSSNDFRAYHNQTNTLFRINTGDLIFNSFVDDGDIKFQLDDGSDPAGLTEYMRLDGGVQRIVYGRSIQVVDNVSIFLGNSATNTDGYLKWDSTASQLFIGGESKFLNDLYVVGDIIGNLTGNVTGGTISGTTGAFSDTITSSKDGIALKMDGGASAEGIRMTPDSSSTYPTFLKSTSPGTGEASPWIYKENVSAWGIWHNNPINSFDFTRSTTTGIEQNVGGETNTVMIRLNNTDGSGTFVGNVSTPEIDLPSGGMVDWANGDARIVEGLVNNYSLSFQTYDGTNVTTALRLDGNNIATFASDVVIGEYIYHQGDANTYFGFPANDRFAITAGGNANLELVSNGVSLRNAGSNKLQTTSTGVSISGSTIISSIANATTDTDKFLVSDSGEIKYRTGAEVASDISATLDGQYVKYNNTTQSTTSVVTINLQNTVATGYNEMLLKNDSNDQIVVGSIGSAYTNTAWVNSAYVYATGTGRNLYLKSQDGNVSIFAGGTALSDVKIQVNDSNTQFLNDAYFSSKLAVATIGVTPYGKMEVGKPLATDTQLTLTGLYNTGNGGPTLNFRTGHGSNAAVWNMAQILVTDDGNFNGRMEFKTTDVSGGSSNPQVEPTTKMVLKSDGSLGINITNLTAGGFAPKLALKQTSNSTWGGINVESAIDDSVFSFSSAAGRHKIGGSYRASAGYKPLDFEIGGSTRMTLDTSGNLSVNTGKIVLSANGTNFEHGYSGNGLVLSHHGIGPSNAIVSGNSVYPDNLYINNGGAASDWSNVVISGNVVIGATPDAGNGGLLVTKTNGTFANANQKRVASFYDGSVNANRPGIILGYDDSSTPHGIVAARTQSGSGTIPGIQFFTYNGSWGPRMTITSGGDVGIGRTPQAPLDVYKVGDVWHTIIGNDSGQLRIGGQTGSGAVIQSRTNSGTSRDLYIQRDGGRVGIGVNSTPYKLTVSDTTNNWAARIENINSENVGVFIANASGYGMAIDSSENDAKYLLKLAGGTGGGNGRGSQIRMIVESSGKVGIGNQSPDNQLTVRASNCIIDSQSTGDSQLIGFRAGYLNHATLCAFFRYTTADAQLYIDNNFVGNNALYSDINFRNKTTGSVLTNRMKIKGSTGYVGISTEEPYSRLQVGSVDTLNMLTIGGRYSVGGGVLNFRSSHPSVSAVWDMAQIKVTDDSNFNGRIEFKTTTSGGNVGTGPTQKMVLKATGFLGIGLNYNPGYPLDVSGTIRATSDVIAYSDRRIKENIVTIDNALEKVTKLRGVTYTRKDIEDKSTKVGVIAQEVLEVLPEVVSKDDEGKYSVAYGNMAGVFIEAIKELENRIKELENKSCNCK